MPDNPLHIDARRPHVIRRWPMKYVYPIVIAVQFIFCVWHVVGKIALNSGVHPLIFALYREIGGTICLLLLARYVDGGGQRMHRSDVPTFILLGFLSFVIVVGFISALSFITAQNAALLQPAVPVFTTLIGVVAGYEVLNAGKVIGIALAVSGAVGVVAIAMSTENDADKAHDLLLGNMLLVIQTFAVSMSIVLQKRVLRNYPSTTVAAWSYGFASAFTLVAASFWLEAGSDAWSFSDDPYAWMALAYAILFSTTAAHTAMAWANTQLRPSTLSIFATIQPFVTTALAVLVLQDASVNIWQLFGACAVGCGLLLTVRSGGGDGGASADDDDATAEAYERDGDEHQPIIHEPDHTIYHEPDTPITPAPNGDGGGAGAGTGAHGADPSEWTILGKDASGLPATDALTGLLPQYKNLLLRRADVSYGSTGASPSTGTSAVPLSRSVSADTHRTLTAPAAAASAEVMSPLPVSSPLVDGHPLLTRDASSVTDGDDEPSSGPGRHRRLKSIPVALPAASLLSTALTPPRSPIAAPLSNGRRAATSVPAIITPGSAAAASASSASSGMGGLSSPIGGEI